jgi:predicted histone-like DNA-binding protein
MAIRLKKIVKVNPQDRHQSKFYLVQESVGVVDIYSMAKKIARGEDTTEGNVLAVFTGLLHEMSSMLALGQTIRLGAFGSFHLSVQSEGADTPEALTAHNVKHVKVVFYPGTELRDALGHLSFHIESSGFGDATETGEPQEIAVIHEPLNVKTEE